jgi:hypothetical protein
VKGVFYMRRLLPGILCAVVLIYAAPAALANSGPVYWQGYPSAGIMAVERNSPIKVEREDLVFDFSDSADSDYTVNGRATAVYKMSNPTGETQSVRMAFPFVGSAYSLSPDDIVITADGALLPYDVYIGEAVKSYANRDPQMKEASFEFEDIVSTITDKTYIAKSFKESDKGKLYTIYVEPTTDQDINVAVDFSFNRNKTKILTGGFDRLEWDGQKLRIASWCRKAGVLEVFVLGEDIKLEINAYTDGELSERTGLFSYRVEEEQKEIKTYLAEYVVRFVNAERNDMLSDVQIYNLYAKAFDECLSRHMGLCSEGDLRSSGEQKRIITLVYTVEFPPESQKEVSVSFTATGTMDNRKTVKPLYSFEYILSPAKNWAGFKDLNIEVIPPAAAPYIVQSSTALTKGEDGVYRASLDRLPEEDLSFTLYAFDKITLLDRAYGSVQRRFGYLTPIVLGAALPLIVGAAVAAAVLRRKL